MSHRLMVVFGLPGSGKTTIARKIHKTLGEENCRVLRTDEIRKELFPRPIYSKAEADETFAEMYHRADVFLQQGKTVVLDGVFAKQQERDEVRKIAEKNNCECQFLHIFVDERTIKERLLKHSEEAGEADFEVYLKLKRLFDPIHEQAREIDNSREIERLDWWIEMIVK